MKNIKRFFGIALTLLFVLSVVFVVPATAEAKEYTYTVNIALGDNIHASFDEAALSVVNKDGNANTNVSTKVVNRTTEDGKKVPFRLEISNLSYEDVISFDAASLVKIASSEAGSKYYVKGIRRSGADALEAGGTNVALTVKEDEAYVAAYGVGNIIPYKVKYLDTAGNVLYEAETLYGAEGEEAIVPARHVPDYKPDKVERTVTLAKGTAVTFTYEKLPATVTYETTYETKTVYTKGEPTYIYEYEYNEGEPTVITNTNTNPTTAVNRGVVNNRATATATSTEAVTATAEGTDDNGFVDENADDTTTIGEEETPTNGEVETIEDEETPKAIMEQSHLARSMIITLIILVILTLVVMFIVSQMRNNAITTSNDKDEYKK